MSKKARQTGNSTNSRHASVRPVLAQSDLQEQVQQRAYELYEAPGRVEGFAEEDWRQAEREVLGLHLTDSDR